MKKLYTFTIKSTEATETRETLEDGTIKIIPGEKLIENKFYIKSPNTRERDLYTLKYDVEFSKAITAGIAPWDVMRKLLLDNGGVEAKVDLSLIDEIQKKISDLQLEYVNADKNDIPKMESMKKDMQEYHQEFVKYQARENQYFSRCAEARAQSKVVFWCVLNLVFTEKDTPLFPGANDEIRENNYYETCEKDENSTSLKAFDKAFVLMESWIKGSVILEEDFKILEEMFDDYAKK